MIHTVIVESDCFRLYEEFRFGVGVSAPTPRYGETYVDQQDRSWKVVKVSTQYNEDRSQTNCTTRVKVSDV